MTRRPRRGRPLEPDVTVCVPAFQAEAFIAETLAAVAEQSYEGLRVAVSIDASSDGTEAVCRRFEGDSRFTLVVQPDRLGWVGNINFLLDRVETPFFFILPHDDLLDPSYVEALREESKRAPEAVNAYCDVQTYGANEALRSISSLDGPLAVRALHFVTAPVQGPPFRGLTRSWALERGLRLRDNPFTGYGAHTLWVLQLLCLAPFRHVPRALYRRHSRDEPNAVTQGWKERPRAEKLAAWAEHSLACLEVLAAADVNEQDRLRLILAQLVRTIELAPGGRRAEVSEGRGRRAQMATLATLATRLLAGDELDAEALHAVQEDADLWAALGRARGG